MQDSFVGRRARCALVAGAVLCAAGSTLGVQSSNTNLNVNAHVGATFLYGMGYTGTRAVMANVEGGNIWAGHETLNHVTTFFNAPPGAGQTQSGEVDRHATWVGHMMGGRDSGAGYPTAQLGIAHGADLWSAALASSWVGAPFTLNFSYNGATLGAAYNGPILTGVGGRTADVINSSWGGGSTSGYDAHGAFTDYLMNATGKTFVVSAMNNGPGPDTVLSPGAAWNNITAAALGSDGGPNPYNAVSGFSSRGPSRFFNPVTGVGINGVRATVDLAAPGQDLIGAFYGGTTGGNIGGVASGAPNFYTFGIAGTSFAAPIIAGGAALLVDVAYDKYAANAQSRDGRVIKAVLQNSARKIPGWNNGQANVGGVIQTTQSLDWASGAGAMDLQTAYTQFTGGTTDVAGLGGGTVDPIGWDYGQVAQGAPNDYYVNQLLAGGSLFTVSLNWFVDSTYDLFGGDVNSLDDLQLQVFEDAAVGPDVLVAQSISFYNNVEHLHFELPRDGKYYIRVLWNGELFDRFGDANNEFYGLAWSGVAVPGPGGVMLLALGGAMGARRRRRS